MRLQNIILGPKKHQHRDAEPTPLPSIEGVPAGSPRDGLSRQGACRTPDATQGSECEGMVATVDSEPGKGSDWEEPSTSDPQEDWRVPFLTWLNNQELPTNQTEARRLA